MLLASTIGSITFLCTLKLPLAFSDAHKATIGRITYCGFPIPWIGYADGLSIMQTLGRAHDWILPINLMLHVVAICYLLKVRTWWKIVICVAISPFPLLLALLAKFYWDTQICLII